MMKKIVAKPLAACTAAVLMTSALLVPTMAANAAASQNQAQRSAVSSIGESKAKEIALQHAGIGASQVSWIIVQQDYEHGRMEYEVEFYAGNQEYDYEIDASSGKILSFTTISTGMPPIPFSSPIPTSARKKPSPSRSAMPV